MEGEKVSRADDREPSHNMTPDNGSAGAHDEQDTTNTESKTRAETAGQASGSSPCGHDGHSHSHNHGHDHDHGQGHGHGHSVGSRSDADLSALRDPEPGTGVTRVAMTIAGMDCSGCGGTMERALRRIPGVSTVRVNFVMGRAEFILDTSTTTIERAVRSVERATGFSCTVLVRDDQGLDVMVAGSDTRVEDLIGRAEATEGVTRAVILHKTRRIIRLYYDPTVVGARTLLASLDLHSEDLAPPDEDPSVRSGVRRMWDQLIKTVVAAILTIPVAVLAWADHLPVSARTRSLVSTILATLVQLIAIPDFYLPALGALFRSGVVEMDMLVVVSITAAYAYSVVAFGFRMAGHPLDTPEFFETSTLLITLVLLGRLVTAVARNRAVSAVSLRSLQAARATIIEEGSDTIEVDARLLQYDDVIKISSHTVVPTDAVVESGISEVDESMLTGESLPVLKNVGNPVIAGTMNGAGTLTARLTRLPGRNTVTDIAQLVEEASSRRPRVQDVADKVASYFVLVVSVTAVLVAGAWVAVGLLIRGYGVEKAVANAVTYAVATLAVSCPCALGLAVPMVLVVAGGIAARNGVVIKSTKVAELARRVTDVVFDKTGTLTQDDMDVEEEVALGGGVVEILGVCRTLVTGNRHPVSMALAKYLEQREINGVPLDAIQVTPGHGVEGSYEGITVRAGNPQWTNAEDHGEVARLRNNGMTLLVVSRDSRAIVAFGLRTRIRPEAKEVVADLIRRGITVHIVSGDEDRAVKDAAAHLGITNMASRCDPRQKAEYVTSLGQDAVERAGSRKTVTLFVGDGTNDAAAVASADIGVQMGSASSASEVTRGAADVVLLSGLQGVPFLLDVSAVSYRRIVFNFAWSALYNVSAILLASGALVKVRVPPAYAGLGEIVSVLPVVAAALTMLLTRIRAV